MAKQRNGAQDNLNVKREQGVAPMKIASPMTTPFSPSQRGTFDDFMNMGVPEDTLERMPKPNPKHRA